MNKKYNSVCCAVLFTAAVLGIALASVLYMLLSTDTLAAFFREECNGICELFLLWRGELCTLCLAFCFGFLGLGLLPFSLLVLLRIARLTLQCYLFCTFYTVWHCLWQITVSGLLALLFLCFCRLAYLYGLYRRKSTHHKIRYTLQFVADFLFFCGICTIIQLLFQYAVFA